MGLIPNIFLDNVEMIELCSILTVFLPLDWSTSLSFNFLSNKSDISLSENLYCIESTCHILLP